MKGKGHHGLICFILGVALSKIVVSTKNVTIHSIGSLRDRGSIQCGSNVTFICSIPTYRYTMKWLIDSDKVAECVTTNCVQYPPYKVDNIGFSPDTSNGEFNMTMHQVTLKADGLKIKSSSGSKSDQLELAVKVLPRRITTEIVESKDDSQNMINITATTGCVFPSSAITMQWYYYEEGHKPKLYKKSSPTEAIIFSVCSSGTCGGNGVVKLSSTLSIPDEQSGNDYFFKIAIRHEDTGGIIMVNSSRSYKLNEKTSEYCNESNLLVVYITLVTSVLIVTIIVALQLNRKLPNLSMPITTIYRDREQCACASAEMYNTETIQCTKWALIEAREASVDKFLGDQDIKQDELNNDDCCSYATTELLHNVVIAKRY